jgi:YD repeat-containing protein
LTATTRILTGNGQGNGTPTGSIVTRQSWDDNSRLTGQTDANANTTAYVYDSLNR